MDEIDDKEVAALWAIHDPKHCDDVNSKTLCLAMFYMVTEKAKDIISYGWWEDKIHHSAMYLVCQKKSILSLRKWRRSLIKTVYFTGRFWR